ncbi:phosphatidylserine decarboxylase family protein [Phanerochaete sordida]|uniref:Phosphatidylserine decarboxylase family protein n=1 Tax=Phanerochaete sordida TaxID=48140 RepID=A0A9P3L7K9_9APHY|nr:phosphatidylserine decarboxylase family protein [Phanerochaete sordida]
MTHAAHGQSGRMVQHRIGGWLPKDHGVLKRWLDKKIALVDHPSRINQELHPVIQEFQRFIEGDPVIYMGFHQMFEQVPQKPPYDKDPTGKPQVRDYHLMLRLFNHIISTAPSYEDNDLVGFPINAILDWPMGTPAGLAMFTDVRVNAQFKQMFDVWAAYLDSPDSRSVLTTADDGWFGPNASAAMPDFVETYVCDPNEEYHGFTCWDNFFTRLFRPGVRPVEFPEDDAIVNNACESTKYRLAHDVKATDTFWLKGEPYSLDYMLAGDAFASQFVGGTVYQAFLSATSYHRWHSPVNGTVVRVVNVPGTYYAESPVMGFPDDPDPAAPNNSQAFITSIAARAIIYVRADNPAIGLMCFVAVGMAEVSTCEVTVRDGQQIKKGEEIGMFHFGGSTHCLIFRPETKITFSEDYPKDKNIPLNAAIATVEAA